MAELHAVAVVGDGGGESQQPMPAIAPTTAAALASLNAMPLYDATAPSGAAALSAADLSADDQDNGHDVESSPSEAPSVTISTFSTSTPRDDDRSYEAHAVRLVRHVLGISAPRAFTRAYTVDFLHSVVADVDFDDIYVRCNAREAAMTFAVGDLFGALRDGVMTPLGESLTSDLGRRHAMPLVQLLMITLDGGHLLSVEIGQKAVEIRAMPPTVPLTARAPDEPLFTNYWIQVGDAQSSRKH